MYQSMSSACSSRSLGHYRHLVETALEQFEYPLVAPSLFDPIRYALGSGGKRIRPVLLLAAYDWSSGFSSGDSLSEALPAALAVEIFHNFTLLHDDIMDRSALRRGKPTVHSKWGQDAAILSGDAMCILAYQCLTETAPEILPSSLRTFNWLATAVCQGQRLDMEFECRDDVTIEEYTSMIYLKTAALLEGSLKIGGQLGGASSEVLQHLGEFGRHLGIAFQLQDDYLDTYGQTEVLGKECGDDICDNKRTYLSIRAYSHADASQRKELDQCLLNEQMPREEKIARVKSVYDALGVSLATKNAINDQLQSARLVLNKAEQAANGSAPSLLYDLLEELTGRDA